MVSKANIKSSALILDTIVMLMMLVCDGLPCDDGAPWCTGGDDGGCVLVVVLVVGGDPESGDDLTDRPSQWLLPF